MQKPGNLKVSKRWEEGRKRPHMQEVGIFESLIIFGNLPSLISQEIWGRVFDFIIKAHLVRAYHVRDLQLKPWACIDIRWCTFSQSHERDTSTSNLVTVPRDGGPWISTLSAHKRIWLLWGVVYGSTSIFSFSSKCFSLVPSTIISQSKNS